MMHDSTLDLFCNSDDEIFADEYVMELEKRANSLEITVDYLIQEFMINC